MSNNNIKKLSEITREEWIVYEWIYIPSHIDVDKYIRGARRDPGESINAGQEWDEWRKAYDALEKGDK